LGQYISAARGEKPRKTSASKMRCGPIQPQLDWLRMNQARPAMKKPPSTMSRT
jgi:hypothetical protein